MQTQFPELKSFQREALRSFHTQSHTILTAPTGSGKSLIFQKYLHETKKTTRAILVSPLNALSRQLAEGFQAHGIPATLGVGRKGEGPPEKSGVWIVSPEKILGCGLSRARGWGPNCLIVDEAHCVWEWGEQFRPEFAEVPSLVNRLQIPKSFWCSATLPFDATFSIQKHLPGPVRKIGRFSVAKGLSISRFQTVPHRKLELLRNLLQRNLNESGMIFVSTRNAAERLNMILNEWGYVSVFYHAGMSTEERIGLEKKLATMRPGQSVWIVATSAFGMGMNYPFLKTCILFEPSLSLLALAQALGRVGRAGASANAYVLWHENDFRSLYAMMKSGSPSGDRLRAVLEWCASESCPKFRLENYFNEGQKSGTFKT